MGAFLPYFFSSYRFRLRDAVRRLDREERHFVPTPVTNPPAGSSTFYSSWVETPDPFAGDAFAAAELRADLAMLSPADRALIAWRIDGGEQFRVIAERLGVNRRTVHRRWDRVRDALEPFVA